MCVPASTRRASGFVVSHRPSRAFPRSRPFKKRVNIIFTRIAPHILAHARVLALSSLART